jgi:hypothetical protein
MITPEMISLVGGTLGGYVMKAYSLKMQDDQARFDRMMNAIKAADDSADRAAQRVPNDKNGNWIRRIIVLAILFGVILGPYILSLIDKPVIVEVVTPVKTWFFGLFSTGGTTLFYELKAYLLSADLRQALLALIGFYFGQSAAKRS